MGTITLLGDSILDNFYHLNNKKQDICKELIDLGFNVENYAVNETKLNDLVNGFVPSEIYRKSRHYPYKTDKEGKFHALKLISCHTFKPIYDGILSLETINDDGMTVLSVGGNDIRTSVSKIIFGVDYFLNSILTKEYIEQYESLIKTLKSKTCRVLIVSVYLPYLGTGSSYGLFASYTTPVLEKWRDFLTKIAIKYNVPILDLSRTFNSTNRDHYGLSDIEPSNISGKCIADCIAYIYENYDGHHVYFAPDCDVGKMQCI